jgi:hypothetical protein
LNHLGGGDKSPKSSAVLPELNPSCVQVETFFLPFELACQSKTAKIVCSALDSIEKLVAYGHISYHHFGNDTDYAIYDAGKRFSFFILFLFSNYS